MPKQTFRRSPTRRTAGFEPRIRQRRAWAGVTALLALCACASGPDRGGVADRALDLVGLQTRRSAAEQAANESAASRPQRVTVRIHAGDSLNTDASGRSLSLVAKFYTVKDVELFLRTPYDAFQGQGAIAGATELREIVLTPGRRYEVVETLPQEARYLAVVGLFRAPDDKRWRFAFDAKAATATGITVGAHGCALSVAEGLPLGASPESLRLAGVNCR